MMPEVIIRAATDSDIVFARAVHHAAFRDFVQERFGEWSKERQDSFFDKAWHAMPNEIVLLGSTPCGYLSVEYAPAHIQIHEIVLHPDVQGKGVGTALLKQIIEKGQQARLPVRLQVLHQNKALHLYRRMGFKECGETATHVLMEYPLP